MKFLLPFARSKVFILFLMTLPLLFLLGKGFQGGFEANPVEFIQLETGRGAMKLFLAVLWISPLKVLFPRNSLFRSLTRHKRLIGVSCFVYALLHLTIYILDSGDWATFLKNMGRPFVFFGISAFGILFLLAATSLDRAVKWMGRKRWKRLHQLAYLAIFLVFLHVLAKEKSNVLFTLAYFVPFALAEFYRVYRALPKRKKKGKK